VKILPKPLVRQHLPGFINLFAGGFGRVPVVSAKTTLSSFRRLRQCTTSGAVVKDNFVFVLVKNSLGCSYGERIDSATCQSQNLRVVRQQTGQMMGAISNLVLSCCIGTAMRGFIGAKEVPLCEALLRSHEMTVIPKHVLSFFVLHVETPLRTGRTLRTRNSALHGQILSSASIQILTTNIAFPVSRSCLERGNRPCGIYDNFLASNCQNRRPSASNFGLRRWDQFISLGPSWDQNPWFYSLFQ
jgi:hypothetical protein